MLVEITLSLTTFSFFQLMSSFGPFVMLSQASRQIYLLLFAKVVDFFHLSNILGRKNDFLSFKFILNCHFVMSVFDYVCFAPVRVYGWFRPK